jgi:hypothetical protein
MSKTLSLFAFIALTVLALPAIAFAQYGGQGLGSALSSDPLSRTKARFAPASMTSPGTPRRRRLSKSSKM